MSIYHIKHSENSNARTPSHFKAIHGVGFMPSPKQISHSRSVYTFIDLLGDIGGLYGLMQLFVGQIVGPLSQFNLFNSLVRQIFLQQEANPQNPQQMKPTPQISFARPFPFWLHCLASNCRPCCTKRTKRLKMAERRLERRLDIVRLIKSQMLLEVLCSLKLTKEERFLAKRQSKHRVLHSETCSETQSSSDTDHHQ